MNRRSFLLSIPLLPVAAKAVTTVTTPKEIVCDPDCYTTDDPPWLNERGWMIYDKSAKCYVPATSENLFSGIHQ